MDKLDDDKRELCYRFIFVTEIENVAINTLKHFDWDAEAAIRTYSENVAINTLKHFDWDAEAAIRTYSENVAINTLKHFDWDAEAAIRTYSENVAINTLKHFDWDAEAAIDYYFDYMPTPDEALMEELYNKYKDPKVDLILADGITQLCSDLQVDPQDIIMLVISWHMQASTMCEYTKEEFCNGLRDLHVDSLDKFREKLAYIRDGLKDEEIYGKIYNFAFGWAMEKGQKSMPLETAIGMWQLLFAERKYPLFHHWIQFIQGGYNKAISRDTWCQLLEFFKQVEKGVADFDAEGAWPYLIDEFVEYLNENGIDPSNIGGK